ncbi:MAG TPA: FAD-binding oxidoreductase [Candidatus Limnocylindrales bacterium]|nr:FAD-binding oxidoreductase [Candidatus Limnocylindrales bacterium]
MTSLQAGIQSRAVSDLRASVGGQVIVPGDAGYDQIRTVMSGAVDKRPSAIVRAADSDDVARVIDHARETGAELAVRSGGHSAAGHSTTDGGIVLDLRDMNAIDIDLERRTAWAGTGLSAGAYTAAAGAHGVATGFGDTGSVGIGGITLGGGIGYLVRKHGLTIDSLLAAEIVTADGDVLLVDAEHHSDLFWAIRGGGGNFGVATRFHFRLHPLDQVVGGMLVLPATPETVAGFMAEAEAAPEELSAIANVMNCPPMPFVAEEHHGELVIMAMLCFAGDAAAGERAVAPFRALGTPLADLLAAIPYPRIYPPDDPDYHPTAVNRTTFIDHVGMAESELIIGRLAASDASLRVAQLRVLGGAMARVPIEATAFAHRSSRMMVSVAAFYAGPDDRPVRQAWVDELSGALYQGDDGAYVNFLGDEGEARARAAYPGSTWHRLAAVKARYDPHNLFRLNHNVPPAAG